MISSIEDQCRAALQSENKTHHLEALYKILEKNHSLAPEIWNSDGFPLIIVQIITNSFYLLNTSAFTAEENKKVKICLDILEILLYNHDIKDSFLKAKLDYYIYPFLLSATDDSLRISTLKSFCAILNEGMPDSMRSSELLPLLLKVVDPASEEIQMLALDALNLILIGVGLEYAVQTLDRFQAIDVVLGALLSKSIFSKNLKILKSLFKIYIRLCDKSHVKQKLKEKLPEGLDSKEALSLCEQDKELKDLRQEFLTLVS